MSEKKSFYREHVKFLSVAASMFAVMSVGLGGAFVAPSLAQAADPTGVISGRVTADQGDVRALRVKVTDEANRITYTVFTNGGRYQIFNLPPGAYEVSVLEHEFDSPNVPVELKAGETKTADLAIKALPTLPPDKAEGLYEQRGKMVDLVDYDTLYPPGPGRDILEQKCFGCHGTAYDTHWHRAPGKTKAEWAEAFKRMYDQEAYDKKRIANIGAPPILEYPLSDEDKDTVLDYFATNFGPNRPERDLKLDQVTRDENVLAETVYITYHYPPRRGAHDVFPSEALPGTLWNANIGGGYIVATDTTIADPEERHREWQIPNPDGINAFPHGVVECKGKVYWTGMADDTIGEMDIKTMEITRHVMPTRGGGSHTPRADSKCNIWATQVYGPSRIVRLDAETKEMTDYAPLAGANWYGIVVDQQDRVWAASYGAPAAAMYDPKTDKWKIFDMSHGIRRITVDPNGKVWGNQYFGNKISKIDPDTGTVTDYELPVKHATIYEGISDLEGNIWAESQPYNGLFKFNQETEKWTYFPNPVLRGHTPKMEVDSEGTIWYGMSGALMALKPNGNVPMKVSSSR